MRQRLAVGCSLTVLSHPLPGCQSWPWLEEQEFLYFCLPGRVGIQLGRVGIISYLILKSLTSPKLPIECTYEEMIKLMGDYLEPKLTIPFLPMCSEGRGERSDVCRQVEGQRQLSLSPTSNLFFGCKVSSVSL